MKPRHTTRHIFALVIIAICTYGIVIAYDKVVEKEIKAARARPKGSLAGRMRLQFDFQYYPERSCAKHGKIEGAGVFIVRDCDAKGLYCMRCILEKAVIGIPKLEEK